jgi:4a-hydroxytetrahydrobiopterin dehydratase
MNELSAQHCTRIAKGAPALPRAAVDALLREVEGWTLTDSSDEIHKLFRFANYYETLAFVNALAWIAHREDHHPNLEVGYNRCLVRYRTHAVNGLSENDFICAAKIDALSPLKTA